MPSKAAADPVTSQHAAACAGRAPRPAGTHGPTPEALAAYQKVRLPLSGAVQEASLQVSGQGLHGARLVCVQRSRTHLHDLKQFAGFRAGRDLRSPAALQLFKDFKSGNVGKNEIEVNTERGFTSRTFEPLMATSAAVAAP